MHLPNETSVTTLNAVTVNVWLWLEIILNKPRRLGLSDGRPHKRQRRVDTKVQPRGLRSDCRRWRQGGQPEDIRRQIDHRGVCRGWPQGLHVPHVRCPRPGWRGTILDQGEDPCRGHHLADGKHLALTPVLIFPPIFR